MNDKIINILGLGKSTARPAAEIAARLNIEDDPSFQRLRNMIRNIIERGVAPIGSCQNGYYLINSDGEFRENIEQLESRQEAIAVRAGHLMTAWQLELERRARKKARSDALLQNDVGNDDVEEIEDEQG